MDRRGRRDRLFRILNLYERRRSYKNFVESYVRARHRLLNAFQSQSDLSKSKQYLAKETSFYLNESKKLLRSGEIFSALFFAVQAERRLFSLFQGRDGSTQIIDLKKEWYRSYLRDNLDSVSKKERAKITNLVEKEPLTGEEWRRIVNASTKIRLEKIRNDFEKEMIYDRIVMHLFYFSSFAIILSSIIVLTATLSGNHIIEFASPLTTDVAKGTATTNETVAGNATANETAAGNITNSSVPPSESSSRSNLLNRFSGALDRFSSFLQALSPYILIFAAGGLGASVSGLLSKRETDLKKALDEKEIEDWMNFSRVLLGAASALIVTVLVSSNFINISPNGNGTLEVLFAAAIAAGFSDQLLTSSLQRVQTGDQNGDTSGAVTSGDSTVIGDENGSTPDNSSGNDVGSKSSKKSDPVRAERELTLQIEALVTVPDSSDEDDGSTGENAGEDSEEDEGDTDSAEEGEPTDDEEVEE